MTVESIITIAISLGGSAVGALLTLGAWKSKIESIETLQKQFSTVWDRQNRMESELAHLKGNQYQEGIDSLREDFRRIEKQVTRLATVIDERSGSNWRRPTAEPRWPSESPDTDPPRPTRPRKLRGPGPEET